MATSTSTKQEVEGSTKHHDEGTTTTYSPGFWEVFLLDIGILISGVSVSWNGGLHAGFCSNLVSLSIMSLGYIAMTACLAELTSITNFSGGVYGYSRCSLGPKYGWFFGCSELLQYNLFSLGYVKATAVALSIGLNTKFEFERVWVLFIYALLLGIHMIGSSLFWYSTSFLAVASVIILFMYLLATMISSGSMYNVPLEDRQDNYFNDGVTGFMSSFLYSVWLFSGSECITVAGTLINNGTETIPKVMLVTLAILVFAAYWVLCVVYFSNDPLASIASVSNSYFPLAAGFAEHFSVSLSFGTLCMVPGLFASASGFLFSSSHVCHALSLSGLFSPWFKPVYGRNKIPRRSLVSSVLLQIVLYSIVSNVNLVQTRFAVTVLGLSSSYIGIFASYLTFKQRFPSMERRFTVPMGRYVAYVGIAIFSLLFVSVLIFQEKSYLAVSIYVLYLSGCGVYYFKVAEKRQFFSHEEQKKFMKAYILNANKMKKRNGQRMQNHWYYRMAGNLYELLPKAFTTVLNSSSHGVSSGLAASSDSRGIASEVANVSSNGNDATAVPVLPSIKSNKVIPLKEDNARGAELVAQKANHDAEFDCRENAGCHDPIVVLVPMEAGQSLVSANNNLLSSSMLSMPTLKNNTVATLNHHDSASSVHRPLSRSGSVNSHEKVLQVCWSGMLMNTTQSKTFFEIVAADAEEYDAHPLPRDCENIQEDQEQVYRSLQEQLPQFFSVADPTVRDQSV